MLGNNASLYPIRNISVGSGTDGGETEKEFAADAIIINIKK
jgi:hypothetical protein